MATIVRHRLYADFTIYPNALIRDDRLSFRATGLLVYLLSLPDGSDTDSVKLAKRKREGREAVRTAYSELIEAGYVIRHKHQDAKGQWITTLEVSDNPTPGNAASGGVAPRKPSPENLGVGSSGVKNLRTDDKDYNANSSLEDPGTVVDNDAVPPRKRDGVDTLNGQPRVGCDQCVSGWIYTNDDAVAACPTCRPNEL